MPFLLIIGLIFLVGAITWALRQGRGGDPSTPERGDSGMPYYGDLSSLEHHHTPDCGHHSSDGGDSGGDAGGDGGGGSD